MPEWLIELVSENPSYTYVAVGLVFVLCGVGLPLPEEIVLVSAGYLCYLGHSEYWVMTGVCTAAILVGDLVPFLAGRAFGPRLLRLRWMRFIINRERLAMFDRWFRRRGDLVVVIARFIPGLRVVAFFTGGTMRMRWLRFLILDGCGIILVTPTLVFVGWHFGDKIEETILALRQIERSILVIVVSATTLLVSWYWLRRRNRRSQLVGGPRETYVEQSPEPHPSETEALVARPAPDEKDGESENPGPNGTGPKGIGESPGQGAGKPPDMPL